MDIQKFRIKRSDILTSGATWSIPCSGGTNFYPINHSTNCSGATMYNSTGSQIMDALDSCVMSSFPAELRDCSPTNAIGSVWHLTRSGNR